MEACKMERIFRNVEDIKLAKRIKNKQPHPAKIQRQATKNFL